MTETTASSPMSARPKPGCVVGGAALLALVGADPRDGEELRQKKALLVVLAVLILPVSAAWGGL